MGKETQPSTDPMTHLDFWDSIQNKLLQCFPQDKVSAWIDEIKALYALIPDTDIWPEGENDFKRFMLRVANQAVAQKIDTHT